MELNLKILVQLLQCTSIDRCALFMRAKKKKFNFFILRSHYLFIFYSFYISFSVSLLTASPSLLSSSTDPSLHRRSHKPSCHRPFSPSSISQAQSPQTLPFHFALILFRSRRTKPHCWRRNQPNQLGLNSSMKTVKPCPLAQLSSVGIKTDRVSGMGFGLAVLIFLGFCFVLLH